MFNISEDDLLFVLYEVINRKRTKILWDPGLYDRKLLHDFMAFYRSCVVNTCHYFNSTV